jgi:hypothetical protein
MTWRDKIRPLVSDIIKRVGNGDVKALKQALLEGRPTWVRTCSHQTKVWRDEVKRQTEESDAKEKSREKDVRHYERIAAEVATWPKWKQNLLSDSLEPTLPFDREPVRNEAE